MKVSRGKTPPNSWHYPIAPGVVLQAGDEEGLKKLMFEYRARNNIPIGDLERDIDTYFCTKWPEACNKEVRDYRGGPADPPREPMLNRVTRWASNLATKMPRGGYQLVNSPEAERRAAICVVCPKNVPWKGGCGGCSATTSTLLTQLRGLRSTSRQGNLLGCQITGVDNLTSVHLPLDSWTVPTNQELDLPGPCWRRK